MVLDTQRRLKLTINSNRPVTRQSLNSAASGSVYDGESEGIESDHGEEEDFVKEEDEEDEDPEGEFGRRRTRSASHQKSKGTKPKAKKKSSVEYVDFAAPVQEEVNTRYTSTSGRTTVQKYSYLESSDNDDLVPASRQQSSRISKRSAVVMDSDEEGHLGTRKSSRIQNNRQLRTQSMSSQNSRPSVPKAEIQKNERAKRLERRAQATQRDPSYEEDLDADGEANPEMELDGDAVPTTPEQEQEQPEPAPRRVNSSKNRAVQGYSFRKRAPVNYVIPPPLDETIEPLLAKNSRSRAKGKNRMNWNLNGMDLSRAMGLPLPDDSDSDAPGRSPKKRVGAANGPAAAGGLYASGPVPGDLSGGPANMGKITSSSALADTDPLGVNPNINFDAVGGLDTHIASLKEMTLLPLLYPEVFQRFGVTPPRGVLFHGPPGTGKTLMARALASSCRSDGRSISFFMRKGADCLSKWVGEAERQLRLLFEEAKNSQPSIIFFDEIDGLAPVRSSKQDQIHASIVSTLLALMDGMDGRGQVIVIGATNRPDAIDSALRRPGRFDREFYFGLPSLPDRQSILRIHTHKWEGWEKDSPRGELMRAKLATMTKGYGGADLRMLCTEAALNAVQRTFPQIYKSTDRLLVQPEKIMVHPRDFMSAIKKLVPSSARSTSSTAAPIPPQLVPLLSPALEHVKKVITRILPTNPGKKRDMLEEAEWEWDDDGDEERALEKELLMQSMETLRVYRPRLVLCGGSQGGMGVGYVAAALLDWLEGFHVQSLDLASLMSDSTRTIEAAIVQLFLEAKRRQPSVIYIPSLTGWCATVSETSRSTVKAMLDTLAPTDPVLLLAIVDGPFHSLPRDVRQWFGFSRETNQVNFSDFKPTASQRSDFFQDIVNNVRKRPIDFPDGWKRRKRILEKLPIAPPIAPKPPSEAEVAAQLETDMRTLTVLKYRLGPVLNDLKRKFKLFTRRACEDYGFDPETGVIVIEVQQAQEQAMVNAIFEEPESAVQIVPDDAPMEYIEPPAPKPIEEQPAQVELPSPEAPKPKFHNMDLEVMHGYLYRDRYLSLEDFMGDIAKIAHNAQLAGMLGRADQERSFKAQALLTAAQVHYLDFDPTFREECVKMANRERQRREEKRKEKEKEKEKEKDRESEQNYPPGTRRSNRANGIAPEHGITDIGKIERSLKRVRSSEPNSAKEDGGDDDNRSNKRSRLSGDQGDTQQPQTSGPNAPEGSAQDFQPLIVTPQPQPEILAPATPTPPPQTQPPADTQQPVLNLAEDQTVTAVASSMSLSSLLNGDVAQALPNFIGGTTTIDANPFLPASSSALPGDQQPLQPPVPISQGQMFLNSSEMNSYPQRSHAAPDPTVSQPIISTAALPIVEGQAIPNTETNQEATPPRPPTPPPEFVIDEMRISQLETILAYETERLDVEQLEQLRASALDTIWRARSSWDRNPLIDDLLGLVKEFAHDADAALRGNSDPEDAMSHGY